MFEKLDGKKNEEKLLFKEFDESQRWLLYMALVDSIRSNSGRGFYHDQGHSAYALGCDSSNTHEVRGDSPENNTLFRMMQELSKSLLNYPDINPKDLIMSWKDFCEMATEAYNKHLKTAK